jgi:hypothetical protein
MKGILFVSGFFALPKKDRSRLTNACEKQFTMLGDFKLSAKDYLER